MIDKKNSVRIRSIDMLRGLAILGVVAYHFLYDLDYFGIWRVDFHSWWMLSFEFLVQIIFLGLVGISLYIVFKRKSQEEFERIQLKRFLIILFWAMIISLVTAVFLGQEFVRFGILHLIAVSILILSLIANYKWWQWVILLVLGALGFSFWCFPIEITNEWFVEFGIYPQGFVSVDYFPLVPWLIVPLIGFMSAKFWLGLFRQVDSYFAFENKLGSLIRGMGRKTLWVYLGHQPVLFGVLWIWSQI